MKIHSVTFANINSIKRSLKNPVVIRFDQTPIVDAGLFAITGPTGAGKTTILDAITVALYGRVPRYGSDNPSELMTRHTGECFSEVEFEIKGIQYRSKWSLRRARGKAQGRLQSVVMELTNLSQNKTIESTLKGVRAKIEWLTGLDYRRFTRSAMLAQGDFAAFLKAKGNERGELLERITGTQDYSQISEAAYQKTKLEREKLEQLKAQIDESALLSQEAQKALDAELLEKQQAVQTLDASLVNYQQQLDWLGNLEALGRQETELKANLRLAQERKLALQTDFDRLARHQKTIPFNADLREWKNRSLAVQQSQQAIEQLTQELPKVRRQHQTAEVAQKQATEALEKARQEREKAAPIIDQVLQLEQRLESQEAQTERLLEESKALNYKIRQEKETASRTKSKLELAEKGLEQTKKWLTDYAKDAALQGDIPLIEEQLSLIAKTKVRVLEKRREVNKNVSQLEQTTQDKKDLAQKLKTARHEAGQTKTKRQELEAEAGASISREKTEANVLQLQRTLTDLNRQKELAEDYGKKQKSLGELRLTYRKITIENEEAQKERDKQKQQLKTAEEKQEQLDRIYDLERLVAKYEEDRKKLQSDEPCPLCGSVHHPYVVANRQNEVSKAELNRNEQRIKIKKLQASLVLVEKKLAQLSSTVQAVKDKGAETNKEIDLLQQKFEELNETGKLNNQIEQPEQLQAQWEACKEDLANAEKQKQAVIDRQKQLDEVKNILNKQETQLLKVENDYNNIQKTISRLKEEQLVLDAASQKAAQEWEDLKGKLQERLTHYGTEMPETSQLAQQRFINQLKKRAESYQEKEAQVIDLEKQIIAFKQEVHNLRATIATQSSRLEGIETNRKTAMRVLGQLLGEKDKMSQHFKAANAKEERKRLQQVVTNAEERLATQSKAYAEIDKQMSQHTERLAAERHRLQQEGELLQSLEQSLQVNIQKAGFESIASLEDYKLTTEAAQTIQIQQEQIEDQCKRLVNGIEDNKKVLAKERQKELTKDNTETVLLTQTNTKQQKAEINQAIGSIKEKLTQDAALRQKFSNITQAIHAQTKELKRWTHLNELIGSAKGDKFRKFAQGLTLARLVEWANVHMQKLNPRYRIRKYEYKTAEDAQKDKELEIEIIDTYQADSPRSMRTLSGGESFLVSLALALGLSDLAGKQTRIESLLIDEGFGTLDQDTLDTAISTLENLQAEGKTIGIISHVEALKERISTQIQVRRLSNGHSTVEVVEL